MTSPEHGRKRGRLPSVQDQVDIPGVIQPIASVSPPQHSRSPFDGFGQSSSSHPTPQTVIGYSSPLPQANSNLQTPTGNVAPAKAKPKSKQPSGSKRGTPSASFRNVSACNRCRVRKNRCDQRLPACEACERVGAKCVGWDPFLGRAVPRSYVYFLESRITYLEGLLQENGIEFAPADDFPTLSGPTVHRDTKDDNQLRADSQEADYTSGDGIEGKQSPSKVKNEDNEEAKIDRLVSNIGMVSVQGASDPRYLGSTSGISFARVVLHAVKSTVSRRSSEHTGRRSSKANSVSGAAGSATMRDSVFGLHTKPNIKQAPFPDKDLGLKLVDLYFEHANPQIPTLHRGEFMAIFERVYAPNHSRTSKESYLLNIVFAIGAGIIFDRPENGDSKQAPGNPSNQGTRGPVKRAKLSGGQFQPEEYHASAIIHLESFLGSASADGYGGGLEELQAVLLLASFALLRPVAPGLWYIVGVAMRLAVDLGLHYEDGLSPSGKHQESGATQGERIYPGGSGRTALDQTEIGRREWVRDLRRRLWWCTYSFDRLVGTVVGRPFSISDQIITTSFPSIKDDIFISPTGFISSPNANPPSYKVVAYHYFRLRLLQSEIIQVLQYQSAQKVFSTKNTGEMDPYMHNDLSSPFLQQFDSFGSWRKDMDRRLWLWKEQAPQKEQAGVAFNPQFLELNYWQAVILLYRQSVTTPDALAAEEDNVKDGMSSPHAMDMAPETAEDEDFVYAKIAEAGQKVLRIYRHLHRMHLVNYTYLATHHLFMAGISFLYAIWYSRTVRTYLSLDEVDATILGALSVLDDLTTVCPPARSCKEAFDRMSRTVLQVAQSTTGFGAQATAAITGAVHTATGPVKLGSPTSAPNTYFDVKQPVAAAPLGAANAANVGHPSRYRFDMDLGELFAEDQLSPASSMFWDADPSSLGSNEDLSFLNDFDFAPGLSGDASGMMNPGNAAAAPSLSTFHPWNMGMIEGSHDWSEGNGENFFGGYFFGGGGGPFFEVNDPFEPPAPGNEPG